MYSSLGDLGWHQADHTMAVQLTASTNYPGRVVPCSVTVIDPGIAKMPGIKEAYISGSVEHPLLVSSASGFGAFVVEQVVEGLGKAYVWGFAKDDQERVWYRPAEKPYEGHHFDPSDGIDINTLFQAIGSIAINNKSEN